MKYEQTRAVVIAMLDWRSRNSAKDTEEFLAAVDESIYLFCQSVARSADGDHAALLKYLRSNKPLAGSHRDLLANLIEGKLKRSPKRGAPKREIEHKAARLARLFYRQWRAENKRAGINDWGDADTMKDDAIKTVCEITESFRGADQAVVRDIFDRCR